MINKANLMRSASGVATAVAAVAVYSPAHAAGTTPEMPSVTGYTYSIQGGLLFTQLTDPFWEDKIGTEFRTGPGTVVQDFTPDPGFNGAATLGVKLGENWDASFGLSINDFQSSTAHYRDDFFSSSFQNGGYGGSYTGFFDFNSHRTFNFETADFDVGYTPKLGKGMTFRLAAGIRALRFDSDTTETGSYGFSYTSFTPSSSFSVKSWAGISEGIRSVFIGAGPRISAQGSDRFGDSKWGLSGEVGFAAIFGRQTDTFTSGFFSGFSGKNNGSSFSGGFSSSHTSGSSSYTKTVFDIDAQLGVDYYLTDTSKLTVGVQGSELTNVGEGQNSGVNQISTGAFVKFTGNL